MKRILILVCVFRCLILDALTPKCIHLESPDYIGGAGMFHNFNIVLGCLELLDNNPSLALKVDFKEKGLYYEPALGPNWWSYYFETSYFPAREKVLKRPVVKTLKDPEKAELGNAMHFYGSKDLAHLLITKYLRVKQEIIAEVEAFSQTHFIGKQLIGVHFRGSDKWLESNPVSYEQATFAVKQVVEAMEDYVIFVATDEQGFLDAMVQVFGSKVVFTASERSASQQPLHYFTTSPYKQGKEALIDCLLLAKSSTLIRTNSNLSAVSAFFNPTMQVINLNTVNPRLYEGISKKGKLNPLNQL